MRKLRVGVEWLGPEAGPERQRKGHTRVHARELTSDRRSRSVKPLQFISHSMSVKEVSGARSRVRARARVREWTPASAVD
jgi:hypothetical protein